MFDEYILPGEDRFPEGITEGTDESTFYVSSSATGAVFRGDLTARELAEWLPGGGDGRTRALGLAVDAEHGRLLVCGGDTGVLFAYGLSTGDLIAALPVPGAPSLLNDVCVSGGHAYVTDSLRPVVWRFPLDADGLGPAEEWLDVGKFGTFDGPHGAYLNGIVAFPGGDTLLVVGQGSEDLWRVDVAARTAERVDLGGLAVAGDGMLLLGDLLYVLDNTEEADGTVRIWLSAFRSGTGWRTAERVGRWERDGNETPTTLAYLGGRLLLVNSQFTPKANGTAKAPFTVSAIDPPM